METNDPNCNSCGIPLREQGAARFSCPACGDSTIGRCYKCRDQSVNYTCPECGFMGP